MKKPQANHLKQLEAMANSPGLDPKAKRNLEKQIAEAKKATSGKGAKAAAPKKGSGMPPHLKAALDKKKAEAAKAAAAPEKSPKPEKPAKEPAMSKPAKKTTSKANKAKKAKTANRAAPEAKPKTKKGTAKTAKAKAKKAAPKPKAAPKAAKKKKAAKAAQAAPAAPAPKAAPKPKAKKPAKKAAKKPAPKPAAPPAKKPAAKKAKKAKKKTQTSKSIVTHGKKVPASVKNASKGMKKVSTTAAYKDPKTGRKLTIKHVPRLTNPIEMGREEGMSGIKLFSILAGTTVLGYVGADFVDRLIATSAGEAKYPWMSIDAAQRIMLRPDGRRLFVNGVIAVGLFGVSAALAKKTPTIAAITAGLGLGATVKLGSDLLIKFLMPAIFKVEKGTERSIGNRIYPMEQMGAQEPARAAIEAQDKAWQSAPGQGGTDQELPPSPSFLFAPATPAASAPASGTFGPHMNPLAAKQLRPRSVGTAPLPAGRPQFNYMGEPKAQAAAAKKPTGVGEPCPGCSQQHQDVPTNGAGRGVNVAPMPRPAAPPPAAREETETLIPGPQEGMPRGTGSVAAFTYGPQRPNGRPRGTVTLPGSKAALSGGHMRRSHLS